MVEGKLDAIEMACINADLHLTSPKCLGRVSNKTASPVALDTSNNVVCAACDTLRDDTEAMVLHGCRTADTSKEALLNTLVKLDNGNTRRGL